MRVVKRTPPPVPQPPATYEIVGLTDLQRVILRGVVNEGLKKASQDRSDADKIAFLDRLYKCLGGDIPEAKPEKL